MFDVAFSELIVIALVALIVIGPERLPKVARTAGILLGRLQRYVNDVKSDIQREMQMEELKKVQENVAAQVRDMEQAVSEKMKVIENDINQSLEAGLDAKAPSAEQIPAPNDVGAAAAEVTAVAPSPAAPVAIGEMPPGEKPHA